MAVVRAPTLCPDPGRWECGTRSKQPTVFRLVRLDYYYISSLTRGIQNLLRQEPEREQKPIPGTKFDKETIAGHVGDQNGSYIIVHRPDSGVLRILSSCSRPQTKTEPATGKLNPESMGVPDKESCKISTSESSVRTSLCALDSFVLTVSISVPCSWIRRLAV